jgi:site-specific DNA-cytosine methylase
MRVLVACEYSGTVRDAFIRAGHYAASCDLAPSDSPLGDHYQCNVLDILDHDWDLMIAHPPCTHLAVSGARWFKDKQQEQQEALEFVRQLLAAPIPRIALENPVSIISSRIRKPDQTIQPWQFGEEAQKTTCLWLKDLPLLVPTKIVGKGDFYTAPSGKKLPSWYGDTVVDGKKIGWNTPEIKKIRSKTFKGIADAMAAQWGVDRIQGSLL